MADHVVPLPDGTALRRVTIRRRGKGFDPPRDDFDEPRWFLNDEPIETDDAILMLRSAFGSERVPFDTWPMPDRTVLARHINLAVADFRTGPFEWTLDGEPIAEIDGQWLWLGRVEAWNGGWRPGDVDPG